MHDCLCQLAPLATTSDESPIRLGRAPRFTAVLLALWRAMSTEETRLRASVLCSHRMIYCKRQKTAPVLCLEVRVCALSPACCRGSSEETLTASSNRLNHSMVWKECKELFQLQALLEASASRVRINDRAAPQLCCQHVSHSTDLRQQTPRKVKAQLSQSLPPMGHTQSCKD